MSVYILTATRGGVTSEEELHAEDDSDATFIAMNRILNLAAGQSEPWASGRIVLEQHGRIVREMAEKGDR